MIRNKTPYLIRFRHQNPKPKSKTSQPLQSQPPWYQNYYHHKQLLQILQTKNTNITQMLRQYQMEPTVYTRIQIQKAITQVCQIIQEVQAWLRGFKYGDGAEAMGRSERAMTAYFQSCLSQEILTIFTSKQQLTSITSQLSHNNSHSRSILHPSPLDLSTNIRSPLDRSTNNPPGTPNQFQQINQRIENLNTMLQKMNAVVIGQGDLVNRIDENLEQGRVNMGLANKELGRRVQRENGEGQFLWEGKVNKVITTLYGVNVIIILMIFIKHLIF